MTHFAYLVKICCLQWELLIILIADTSKRFSEDTSLKIYNSSVWQRIAFQLWFKITEFGKPLPFNNVLLTHRLISVWLFHNHASAFVLGGFRFWSLLRFFLVVLLYSPKIFNETKFHTHASAFVLGGFRFWNLLRFFLVVLLYSPKIFNETKVSFRIFEVFISHVFIWICSCAFVHQHSIISLN